MIPFAALRAGKVVQVNAYDHSVDVVLEGGRIARQVPVLTGYGGSVFGLVGLVAPSFWSDRFRREEKTYPRPAGVEATDDNAVTPPETPAKIVQPPTNLDEGALKKEGRDLYALLAELESPAMGATGYVALGFFFPRVSEMLFPPGDALAEGQAPPEGFDGTRYADLLLFRHPSDVQVTVDKRGKVSIQHPSGARITIGEDFAPVDLKGKDYDQLYALRNNLGRPVRILVQDSAGNRITIIPEGVDRGIKAQDVAGSFVHLDPASGDIVVRSAHFIREN